MKHIQYIINAHIWLYPGETAQWHFITIPKKESNDITLKFAQFKKGWGSLPVEVTLGETVWKTSIFPDKKSGTYLLPIKAIVRRKEGLENGDAVKVHITIMSH